ncbi:MAG: phenylalanine--tRNA ligase subunit beta [Pseudanabaena sp. M135S2SP2A07QC]|nr:phenylalanine--tRNA ligase subunit beta [Pseudanabaena sp. M110S1SP2A07QC]MCA6522327.1 phenylalanine--tRNA ligase subunit beta [Pseudanabaena sp. M051S1SP2A07QC]MCA6527813.1 phenylalanine--tRNA ligase subunit beta [Pseudanabaena sp. M179S2SP2A07QC]MCA6529645.1 phenylalanine--tRNA ligase subunit beta [Pseudanabaena sp. M125S2SP2A07QC]MCA6536787.1 phenylalanine--tRNA ligase subunit beta [Pseudanabaena sp. M176S2SP2A07QC]MCA6541198.1 phenylalanine--tRNA ligase subunit beta [Pseudanabaena sp. M
MRISLNWLRELVDCALSPQELDEKLTMAGFEVESIEDRRTWAEGVVVGHILTAERHPNADKLQVCKVDIGAPEPLQIVCGAANARQGLFVPVATIGTYLPTVDLKLRPTKLRGERSEGMICSLAEIGLAKESSGIHEFPEGVTVGADVRPLLGLDDAILDVTSTANRADALSIVGIAREVAALLGKEVRLPLATTDFQPKAAHWVTVEDSKSCPAYIGTLIKGVKVAPSPEWLKRRVEAAGMRSINNIVDITNYILLEWGQPLHAFDADTLADGIKIGVRFAKSGEKIKTLDDADRSLTAQNLLITSGDKPIAIAGVMGGAETEVSEKTINIVLEAALFTQVTTRRSARAQGLRTEASARYERGVNQAAIESASAKAVQMIMELAGGEVVEQSVMDARSKEVRVIDLRLTKVWQVLGEVDREDDDALALLSESEVEQTLKVLSFELVKQPIEEGSYATWKVTVPPYRYADIEREIDLVEEIARIYGYDKFVETLPARTEFGFLSADQEGGRMIRAAFRAVGLNEVMHMSLCSPAESHQVKINNPVAIEYGALRDDLLTNLIESCAFNINQGNGILNGFEIGRVFWLDEAGSDETDRIAGIFGGDPTVGTWQHESKPMNFYEAKGLMDSVFHNLCISVEYQPDQKDDRLHPGRTASLWISGERLGTFGQMHPQLRAEKELPDEIYAFELDFYTLLDAMMKKSIPTFHPFSTYPSSDRDIAFFAPLKFTVADIHRSITHVGGELLDSVTLFDQYIGKGVPEGLRSLAFRLVYRASDRTLTDVDINPVHQKVRDLLEEKFQATLRS